MLFRHARTCSGHPRLVAARRKDVDGRDKHGHDDERQRRSSHGELTVLSAEKNRLLTQVGPGTPMGELLRRYWMPIAAISELDETPTKPVRLMAEDLVLFKDLGGRY